MKVDWSENATTQLIAARDFLSRDSPGYATILTGRIVRRTEELGNQPFLGAEVPEYADEGLRELYEHPYRILYRVESDRVEIVAVIHSARRLPRTPPG